MVRIVELRVLKLNRQQLTWCCYMQKEKRTSISPLSGRDRQSIRLYTSRYFFPEKKEDQAPKTMKKTFKMFPATLKIGGLFFSPGSSFETVIGHRTLIEFRILSTQNMISLTRILAPTPIKPRKSLKNEEVKQN